MTGRYPMTTARKPNPIPDSATVRTRPCEDGGVTSPRPRVKNVVPLMYRFVPKELEPVVRAAACMRANPAIRPKAQNAKSMIRERGPNAERRPCRTFPGGSRRARAELGTQVDR